MLEGPKRLGVHAVNVQTGNEYTRRSWVHIFARMDILPVIIGGSTMVNPIAGERRS